MAALKLVTLAEAIRREIRPGMHVHFASTPSRSNAAILALAAAFRRESPAFVLSTTGFHSTAHLLPLLRLGKKYVACFFGDNYPIPRPNDLYTRVEAEGAKLEIWSLLSYVNAFRAGALGDAFAITRSLSGTDMGRDLQEAGLLEQRGDLTLVAAMRADVTFVHGLLGDADGNVVFSAPCAEAFWSALGARSGVIATVERVVPSGTLARYVDAMPIAPHRLLAVCEAPFGAHPQSLFAVDRFDVPRYVDDFEHYERWRELSQSPEQLASFFTNVLDRDDVAGAYLDDVGRERLSELCVTAATAMREAEVGRARTRPSIPITGVTGRSLPPAPPRAASERPNEILLVLAARKIAHIVREKGYPLILAGIGHAFLAARMARTWLAGDGFDVKVMVETGLFDIECGAQADEFLLSFRNVAYAKRLSSVENVLGTLTCGSDAAALGVIGTAQIDVQGRLNSTRIGGKVLVGSGGANDIASSAVEVIAICRSSKSRLVERVEYTTCPGDRIRTLVTDLGSFEKTGPESGWAVSELYPAYGGRPPAHAMEMLRGQCGWEIPAESSADYTAIISTREMATIHRLDPHGFHLRRGR